MSLERKHFLTPEPQQLVLDKLKKNVSSTDRDISSRKNRRPYKVLDTNTR